MDYIKKTGFFIVFGAFFLSACEMPQQSSYRTQSIFTKIDSLRANYLNIQDTVVLHWNSMISEDRNCISLMEKMTDKLEYYGYSNSSRLQELRESVKELTRMSSDKYTFVNIALLDSFDRKREELHQELKLASEELKEIEKINQMISALNKSEHKIQNARKRYNKIAFEFNQFIDRYSASIKEITYQDSIGKKPLIRL